MICETGVRPTILLPNVITRAHDARVLPFGAPRGIRTRYLVARSDPREPIAHRAPSGIVSLRALRLRGSAPRPESPCDSCHPDYAREYLPRTPSETGVRSTILPPNVIARAHDARALPLGSPKVIRTPVSALRVPRPRPG